MVIGFLLCSTRNPSPSSVFFALPVIVIRDFIIPFRLLIGYLSDIFFQFMVLLDVLVPGDFIYYFFTAIAPFLRA